MQSQKTPPINFFVATAPPPVQSQQKMVYARITSKGARDAILSFLTSAEALSQAWSGPADHDSSTKRNLLVNLAYDIFCCDCTGGGAVATKNLLGGILCDYTGGAVATKNAIRQNYKQMSA